MTPDLLGSLGEKGILHLDSQGSAGDGASTAEPLFFPEPVQALEVDETVDEPPLSEILAAHAEKDATPPTGFVVSITRGGKGRRLHHTGFCFRVAGEHFRRFEDHGHVEPEAHMYILRRRNCFPAAAAAVVREEAEHEASDGSEASSSVSGPSSHEEEAEAEEE